MALNVGSRLGHYDVTALLVERAMGQVHRATDTTLNRVALQPSERRTETHASHLWNDAPRRKLLYAETDP